MMTSSLAVFSALVVFAQAFDSSEIRMLEDEYEGKGSPMFHYRELPKRDMGSPLIRFGRSAPGAPLIRFGRAPEAQPLIRFGKRSDDGVPLIRFGRAPEAQPLIRFGKRAADGAPLIRFGRAAAPLIRFGRAPAAQPLIRFGRKNPFVMISENKFAQCVFALKLALLGRLIGVDRGPTRGVIRERSGSRRRLMEPLDDVIARMQPLVIGKPFQMQTKTNDWPKLKGNPWVGAFSRHGFWYKLSTGTEKEFATIMEEAYKRDGYFVDVEAIKHWRSIYKVNFLVAKNIRDEVLGCVASQEKGDHAQIGAFFVKEEVRHSGIGSTLFREVLKSSHHKNFSFNAMSHLLSSVSRFNLQLAYARRFYQYVVKSPSGFEKLMDAKWVEELSENSEESKWKAVNDFVEKTVTENRDMRRMMTRDGLKLFAAFDEDGECLGICGRCEPSGGKVPRLLVGPWWATDSAVAEALLRKSLSQFYNPEEDYDFDPDPLAIYRRDVHLFVLETNEKLVVKILDKLAGDDSKIEKKRLYYQTTSNFSSACNFLVKNFRCC
ncbi:unnamed protein product [Caenorhabditis auriculariae]|uniref:N-acetyltransferase domain-containing protein n=1 Tax=Caenorhabditis auriculariae TaxID=2777116 RepID=A0A8S1HSA6_9PELO|nr:unnamed protein product [Caenorhabditis auriculariae]